MDVSYPLPRYSALVKDLVRFIGGADYRLDRAGRPSLRLRTVMFIDLTGQQRALR